MHQPTTAEMLAAGVLEQSFTGRRDRGFFGNWERSNQGNISNKAQFDDLQSFSEKTVFFYG